MSIDALTEHIRSHAVASTGAREVLLDCGPLRRHDRSLEPVQHHIVAERPRHPRLRLNLSAWLVLTSAANVAHEEKEE